MFLIHWRAPDWCRSAVTSLLASDIPVQVTVLDNSGGLTVEGAEVISTGDNLGYAGGANLLLRRWMETTDDRHCFVGAHDLHVESDTLRLLVEAMDRDDRLGIAGPVVEPSGSGSLIRVDRGIEWREWLSGTCLLLNRTMLETIGLFDERFGSYGEDMDLGYRANAAGWKVGRVLAASASGRGSIATDARTRILTNDLLVIAKHHGTAAFNRAIADGIRQLLRGMLLSWRPGDLGRAHRAAVQSWWHALREARARRDEFLVN